MVDVSYCSWHFIDLQRYVRMCLALGVSKNESMAAVRSGANKVVWSEESTITDEYINIFLERG